MENEEKALLWYQHIQAVSFSPHLTNQNMDIGKAVC